MLTGEYKMKNTALNELKLNLEKSLFAIHDTDMVVWADYNPTENYAWIHCVNSFNENCLVIEGSVNSDGTIICNDCSLGINKPVYKIEVIKSVNELIDYVKTWRDNQTDLNACLCEYEKLMHIYDNEDLHGRDLFEIEVLMDLCNEDIKALNLKCAGN